MIEPFNSRVITAVNTSKFVAFISNHIKRHIDEWFVRSLLEAPRPPLIYRLNQGFNALRAIWCSGPDLNQRTPTGKDLESKTH
jgi:hypothetical protein